MNKMLSNIPHKIKVRVKKGESGCFIITLPDYDVFTEADNVSDLFLKVNDLIYTLFDIPKKLQSKIIFFPSNSSERVKAIQEKTYPLLTNYTRFHSSYSYNC